MRRARHQPHALASGCRDCGEPLDWHVLCATGFASALLAEGLQVGFE